jgi:hypothetical protein
MCVRLGLRAIVRESMRALCLRYLLPSRVLPPPRLNLPCNSSSTGLLSALRLETGIPLHRIQARFLHVCSCTRRLLPRMAPFE